jgi:dihydrofolate reductase
MILSQVAAMARNRVIGKNNKLPWNLPEDMKFFREKTKGHILILGRKTFDSLGKPLPGRMHIVISRQALTSENPLVIYVTNLQQGFEEIKRISASWPDEVMIIGGSEIYRQTLPLIDRIYLTVIDQDFDGDAHFPEFSEKEFSLLEQRNFTEPMPFSFRIYERRSSPTS